MAHYITLRSYYNITDFRMNVAMAVFVGIVHDGVLKLVLSDLCSVIILCLSVSLPTEPIHNMYFLEMGLRMRAPMGSCWVRNNCDHLISHVRCLSSLVASKAVESHMCIRVSE